MHEESTPITEDLASLRADVAEIKALASHALRSGERGLFQDLSQHLRDAEAKLAHAVKDRPHNRGPIVVLPANTTRFTPEQPESSVVSMAQSYHFLNMAIREGLFEGKSFCVLLPPTPGPKTTTPRRIAHPYAEVLAAWEAAATWSAS
jgi:hypothetical protein